MNLSSILKYPCRVSKFRSVLHSVERASLNAEPYFISRPVNTLPFRIILFRFKFLITGTDDIFLHSPPYKSKKSPPLPRRRCPPA